MSWIKARFFEPSSWRGVGWLLVAAGLIPSGGVEVVVALGAALVGVVEVVRAEK